MGGAVHRSRRLVARLVQPHSGPVAYRGGDRPVAGRVLVPGVAVGRDDASHRLSRGACGGRASLSRVAPGALLAGQDLVGRGRGNLRQRARPARKGQCRLDDDLPHHLLHDGQPGGLAGHLATRPGSGPGRRRDRGRGRGGTGAVDVAAVPETPALDRAQVQPRHVRVEAALARYARGRGLGPRRGLAAGGARVRGHDSWCGAPGFGRSAARGGGGDIRLGARCRVCRVVRTRRSGRA